MARYCDSLTIFSRRPTSEVPVGDIVIGGGNPVRVQSMTNTDTNDTSASVAQIRRIAAAGGEIVRLTAQGRREAENLAAIRAALRVGGAGCGGKCAGGCSTPLVADIHFLPEAALIAARSVEKVRINPGNFNDKGGQFSELLNICRTNGTALRIGVNHGSLAPAMVERYGDTPEGMVASAMEFLRKCREEDFHNVVVSMKSSNVRVMVHAYRMLAAAMREEGMSYPLHLGVTEAGNDMEGRVKSSVGIGALLADGLGDTIRVSLTEAPENEIPVARKLTACFERLDGKEGRGGQDEPTCHAVPPGHEPIPAVDEQLYSPFEYCRRQSDEVAGVGGFGGSRGEVSGEETRKGGRQVIIGSEITDAMRASFFEAEATGTVDNIPPESIVVLTTDNANAPAAMRSFFLRMEAAGKHNPIIIKRTYTETNLETLQVRAAADTGMLLLDGYGDGLWIEVQSAGKQARGSASEAINPAAPATLTSPTAASPTPALPPASHAAPAPNSATETYPSAPAAPSHAPAITSADLDALSLAILQAARVRISRPEYIACPGCGRTLYDLEKTLKDIKERTSSMVGVKIGVMGCIVNGPGEMADADYGYVGSGPGKITLYKGREVVKRNIPQEEAIDELIKLINSDKMNF